MRSPEKPVAHTPLAQLIAGKMQELGISIKDLASALDISYEHIRRVVRGDCLPSESMLVSICEALEIDQEQAQRCATVDQIRKKYGNIIAELTGKNPALEPIEKVWDLLTPDQRQDAIAMIQAWASRNTAMNSRPATILLPSTPKVGIGGNFNRIKEWLDPKLESMGISAEQFARRCGLSKASIYFYRNDVTRPDVQSMVKMCGVLGVPLEEGLAQFTAKRSGRPKGV